MCAHVALHSFPTRRSSDLCELAVRGEVNPLRGSRSESESEQGVCQSRVLDPKRSDLAMGRVKRDRKSTRLNSSHVSISYAAFCSQTQTTNKSGSRSTQKAN